MATAPKSKRYTIRIGHRHLQLLKKLADHLGITTAEMIRIAPFIAALAATDLSHWRHCKRDALTMIQVNPPWKRS